MSSYRIDIDVHSSKTGDAYKQTATDIDNLSKKSKQASVDIDKHAKSTDKLTNSKKNLGTTLSNATSKLDIFGSGLGSMSTKASGATGAIGGLAASLGAGGLIGVVVAAGIAFAAFAAISFQAAQSSQAEWAKFKGIAESAGKSFEDQKGKVKEFAYEAGIAVADVRTAQQKLIQTNNDSPGALRAVHEMSLALGTNMEDAATAYTRIVSGSGQYKRTLIQLGIKPEDIMDKTTGKINSEKLQKLLEEKYGKAADNFANTSEAAQQRLTNAGQAAMVAFGGVMQGPGIALMNGLAAIIKGITDFFQGVYKNIEPAFNALGAAIGTLQQAFMSIFPAGSGEGAFKWAIWAVSSTLIIVAQVLTAIIPYIITLGQYLWIAGTYVVAFGQALYGAGMWIYNLPGRIYAGIMGGISAISGAFHSAASWVWGLPGRIWGLLANAIPTLRWPSPWDILNAIKGALGLSGPGYNVMSMYNEQKARRTAAMAKAGVTAQNTPAQNRQNLATSFSAWRSPFALRGPGDGINPTYKDYEGHRTNNVWDGNCLTGNCVDMTLGMMERYGGSFAIGSWNGGGHMWYVAPDGRQLDPSRKALEGTWNPPAAGPGSQGKTIIIPVSIGGNKIEEFIVDTAANAVYKSGRF